MAAQRVAEQNSRPGPPRDLTATGRALQIEDEERARCVLLPCWRDAREAPAGRQAGKDVGRMAAADGATQRRIVWRDKKQFGDAAFRFFRQPYLSSASSSVVPTASWRRLGQRQRSAARNGPEVAPSLILHSSAAEHGAQISNFEARPFDGSATTLSNSNQFTSSSCRVAEGLLDQGRVHIDHVDDEPPDRPHLNISSQKEHAVPAGRPLISSSRCRRPR